MHADPGDAEWDFLLHPSGGLVFSVNRIEEQLTVLMTSALANNPLTRMLIDRSPGYGLYLDVQGYVVTASASLLRMLGAEDGWVGHSLLDLADVLLVPDSERDGIDRALMKAVSGNATQLQVTITHEAQDHVIDVNFTPIRGDDLSIVGVLVESGLDLVPSLALEGERRRAQQMSEVARHAPVALVMLDRNLHVLHATDQLLSLISQRRADLIGAPFYEAWPDGLNHQDSHRKALAGGSVTSLEGTYAGPDGAPRRLSRSINPWFDENGNIGGIIIVIDDITDQFNLEQELTQTAAAVMRSEHFYRKLIENNRDGIMLVRAADGHVLFASEGALEMIGLQRHEVVGRSMRHRIHNADLAELLSAYERLEPGNTTSVIVRQKHSSGEWLWLSVLVTNLSNDDAIGAHVLNMRDVTSTLALLQKSRDQSSRLQAALDITSLVLGQTDLIGRITWAANLPAPIEHLDPVGMLPHALVGSLQGRALTRLIRRSIREQTSLRRELEFTAGGARWYFDVHVEPLSDSKGQRSGATVAALNVSEERRATQELLASGRRFRKLVQSNSDIIMVLGNDGEITYLSDALPRLLGWNRVETAARGLSDFIAVEDKKKVRRFIRQLMREGHAQVSEVRVLHSRGDWRWLDCIGRDMRSDPDVHGLVLTIRDVSFRVHNLRELEATRDGTFRALGVALEARDYETLGHTERVVDLTKRFAAALGLPPDQCQALEWGAYLHDIGKMAIPDSILSKPGPLSEEEFRTVKLHPVIGSEMCGSIPFLPAETRQIVRHHHERFDGKGYPDQLAGENIPFPSRIFTIVDVYDALTSTRPYKHAWSSEDAVAELRRHAGYQFDPALVDIFIGRVLAEEEVAEQRSLLA